MYLATKVHPYIKHSIKIFLYSSLQHSVHHGDLLINVMPSTIESKCFHQLG